MRPIGLTALFIFGCHIKLAKREMALLVDWRGDPEPGYHQTLERSLARRLKSAYHTEPLTRRIEAGA